MPPGSSTGRSRAKATAWQESEQGAWITSEAARSSRGGRIPEHEERGDRGARPKSGITGLTTSKAANSRKALMRLPTDILYNSVQNPDSDNSHLFAINCRQLSAPIGRAPVRHRLRRSRPAVGECLAR